MAHHLTNRFHAAGLMHLVEDDVEDLAFINGFAVEDLGFGGRSYVPILHRLSFDSTDRVTSRSVSKASLKCHLERQRNEQAGTLTSPSWERDSSHAFWCMLCVMPVIRFAKSSRAICRSPNSEPGSLLGKLRQRLELFPAHNLRPP